jgi:M3 family oligoendopeptidase
VSVQFSEIKAERPTLDGLAAEYAAIGTALDGANSTEARLAAVRTWDVLRRRYETWTALTSLRFHQDTTDVVAKAERDYADALTPKVTALEVALKRRLLGEPDRPALEAALGSHAFRLWETDITTFDPIIQDDLAAEAKLSARYTELLASADIPFDGTRVNLSGLIRYQEDPDREVRHRAEQARWDFFAAHADELDQLYDQLLKLRHGMASKLGYQNYITLGYRRMRRVDYDEHDVARYRDQVATEVVPLAARLIEQRRRSFGYDTAYYWDEAVSDPMGNPMPAGDHDWMIAQATVMFDRMDPRLGQFFRLMREGQLIDLKTRSGKAGGGFCTSFPTHGVPFIFANFNGTMGDVDVFTHELGHAFQAYESRHAKLLDYLWPTMEAAEINSMALEYLSFPYMDLMFGPAAERYRRAHLTDALLFLPYGVAIDHFQHLVYANPNATPAERHGFWQDMEARYLPWRNYGDLAFPAKGGAWQAKQHVYTVPLYYIDYTLALCCAMQFWVKSQHDFKTSLNDYAALCARGGEAPFRDLVRSANLVSPFEPGALTEVVAEAKRFLAV